MKKGLLNVDWGNILDFSSAEISYFLFLEGKNIETISLIRNIDRGEIQKQIIEGKIKYRYLLKSKRPIDLIREIDSAPKIDRKQILEMLNESNKNELIYFINDNYVDMSVNEKIRSVWIIGELKALYCKGILVKASVHKLVNVRRMAISAMTKINNIYFEQVLIRTLNDNNPQVVMYSIKGLTNLKSYKAKVKIIQISEKWNKDYITRIADDYFKAIESKDII
ncbi:HEAT repeat domain-containing protein [Clostridium sp. DL1XJH146]